MSKFNKRPFVRRDIKQPDIKLPEIGYVGQDLGSLLGNNQSKIDMNWLDQLGGSQPKSGDTGSGPGAIIPGNKSKDPISFDSDWTDILSQLGNNSDFTQFLASLGIGGKDPYDQLMHDFNKELLKQILQYYITKEQRSYDRSLQLDERNYNTAANQLARLMGAGISRDAAIQLLGGSGGSGSASVPYGITGNTAELESASQAYANQMSGGAAVAGAVINGVGAVMGLVNLGLTIPQAVSQISVLRNQQYMSTQQRKAYDASSAAFSIINNAGVPTTSETFGSVQNVMSTLASLAESGNAAALSFIQNGGAQMLHESSPYVSPMLSQMYRNERDASDYANYTDRQFGLMDSQIAIGKITQENLSKEGKNLEATYDQILANTDFLHEQANLCTEQAKYYDELAKTEPTKRKYYQDLAKQARAAADQYRASAANFREQTRGLKMENDITQGVYSMQDEFTGKSGKTLLIEANWNKIYSAARTISYSNDRFLWKKEVNALLADAECRESVSMLNKMYNDGTLDMMREQGDDVTNLMYLCNALQSNGVFDYITTYANAGESSVHGPLGLGATTKGNMPFGTPPNFLPKRK